MNQHYTPSNNEDLQAHIQKLTLKEGLSHLDLLRPVGSQTSKSPCFQSQGTLIHLDHFQTLKRLENNQVEVGAGVILKDLLSFLDQKDLALPNIGEWHGQTVGGAISTGTHGGSYFHGSVASVVKSLTFVDGQGQVHTFQEEDPEFPHLLPSFGLTGIALSYVLQCEPSFTIDLKRHLLKFDDYLPRLLNPQGAEFQAAIWLPALDYVLDYSGERSDTIDPHALPQRETRFNTPTLILDWLSKKLAYAGRDFEGQTWRGRLANRLAFWASRLLKPRQYSGLYHHMIAPLNGSAEAILKKRARNRTPPEGEFAVSLTQAKALIQELRALFAQTGYYPDRPIGLRPAAAERGTLFASQGQAAVWVSLFIYPENPLMQKIPKILMRYQARQHWGKCSFQPLSEIHQLYPQWSEFKTYRNRLDPQGKFLNSFAQELGLTPNQSKEDS